MKVEDLVKVWGRRDDRNTIVSIEHKLNKSIKTTRSVLECSLDNFLNPSLEEDSYGKVDPERVAYLKGLRVLSWDTEQNDDPYEFSVTLHVIVDRKKVVEEDAL